MAASLPPFNEARSPADPARVDSSSALVRRLRPQIEAVIDRLRPGLLVDGGNVELIDVDDAGVVSVLFQGACATCPSQLATLRFVLEATLRTEVPAITQVLPVEPLATS
jgi:Fe-S cluster biogenesis protein NfuA